MKNLRRTAVLLLATAGTAAALAGTAQASDAPGILCRAHSDAAVYSPHTGEYKYTIPAGHDMRVHDVRSDGRMFYGHGGPRNDDGWAFVSNFSFCR